MSKSDVMRQYYMLDSNTLMVEGNVASIFNAHKICEEFSASNLASQKGDIREYFLKCSHILINWFT